jgi:hypothetical protein
MKSKNKINKTNILKNKTLAKSNEVVKIREQNQADDHYLMGGLRNAAYL